MWEGFSEYLFSEVKLSRENQGEILLKSRYKLICKGLKGKILNRASFRSFMSQTHQRGCSSRYMNNLIKLGKHLNSYLKEDFGYDANLSDYSYFEEEKKIYDIFTVDEVKAIYSLDYPYEKLFEYRNLKFKTIFRVLPETGIRRLELLKLKWSDIMSDKSLRVGVKTKTERLVPISDDLYEQLMSLPKKSEFVFPSEKGSDTGMMGLTIVRDDLAKRKKHLGITSPDKTVHKYRHFFATDLLRNGANLKHIQWLLGHKSIASTEDYLHYLTEELRETVMIYSSLRQGKDVFFAICDRVISLITRICKDKVTITVHKDVDKRSLSIMLTG
jgi:integrase